MSVTIKLVPLNARFLMPYFKGFTENVTQYQMSEPFLNPGETACYFKECKDRESAGYSLVRIILDKSGRFVGSIEANALTGPVPFVGLWVSEQYRNLGYGSKALSEILDMLRDRGFCYVLYETDMRNESAKALVSRFNAIETEGKPETVCVTDTKTLLLKKYVIKL